MSISNNINEGPGDTGADTGASTPSHSSSSQTPGPSPIRSRDHEWWMDHGNLTALGYYLTHLKNYKTKYLQDYYEKPWHYFEQWQEYQHSLTIWKDGAR